MTTTVVYASLTDEQYLRSEDESASLALAGTGTVQTAQAATLLPRCGMHEQTVGDSYRVYQNWQPFDTSAVPVTDAVSDVKYELYITNLLEAGDSTYEIEVHEAAYETAWAGYFANQTELQAATILFSHDPASTGAHFEFTQDAPGAANASIVKGGTTYYRIATSGNRTKSTWTDTQYVIYRGGANTGGLAPRITITHSAYPSSAMMFGCNF